MRSRKASEGTPSYTIQPGFFASVSLFPFKVQRYKWFPSTSNSAAAQQLPPEDELPLIISFGRPGGTPPRVTAIVSELFFSMLSGQRNSGGTFSNQSIA